METQDTNLTTQKKTFRDLQESQEKTCESNISEKAKLAKEALEFMRIKQAVEEAEEIDNSEKILKLKKLIQDGMYDVDLDELSEKITKHLL